MELPVEQPIESPPAIVECIGSDNRSYIMDEFYKSVPSTREWRIKVAKKFKIPHLVFEAIRNVEAGHSGHIRVNGNGSCDVGEMQINSTNWHVFESMGITPNQLRWNGKLSVLAAGYHLRNIYDNAKKNGQLNSWEDFLQITATYHSDTPQYNMKYQQNLANAILKVVAKD